MGWLSFLSRKSSVADSPGGLKAQAYNETVAAIPPIRGTYPVPGNGPSILEKFQKSHPHLRDVSFIHDNSALPPVVPRLLERPNTAPNHQLPEGSPRPKSQSGSSARLLRDPPKKRHGPYRLPSKLPYDGNDHVANKSIHSVSSAFPRDRNSSIFSGDSGSTRRFVDLLDAQSFIKPSDFYGRVKATGTKDYDEEVADRNIGANGSKQTSAQVQGFHSKHPASNTQYNDNEDGRPLSLNKRHSLGSSLRNKTTNSNLHSALPEMPTLHIRRESRDESEITPDQKASHRRSLHSYVPSSSADRPRSASAKRMKETEANRFSDSLRDKARAAARDDRERDSFPDVSLESKSKNAKGVPAKENPSIETFPSYTRIDSKQSLHAQESQQKPTKDRSRRRTMSHVSSLATVKSSSSSRRDSLQSFRSTSRKDPIAESNLASVDEYLYKRKSRSSSKQHSDHFTDFSGSFSELPQLRPMGTPQLKPTSSRLSSRDGLNYHDGDRSVVSVSKKSSKRPETEDVFPERGSSLRRWSLTSETAGSTLSSNPFRPQSGHTTNTSIDLAPRMPPAKPLEPKHAPFTSGDKYAAPESRMETRTYESLYQEVDPEPKMLVGSFGNLVREQHSTEFVIEEDTASIDSFDAPQRSAGEFEKDLLFQGYGLEGSQLPGLPGLFDAGDRTPEPILSRRTNKTLTHKESSRLAAFSPSVDDGVHRYASGPQYSTRSSQYASLPRSSRLRMPTIRYSDSEDDSDSERGYESEEELNFDIPKTRSRSVASRYDSRSSSRRRYVPSERHFEEEDLHMEFPDAAQLARLRREAKAKQRAIKGKGKARDVGVPRIGLDDPSSYADVDS
ncbi:Type 2A phosphatase-associated protein 42 [Hypoxylon texense]